MTATPPIESDLARAERHVEEGERRIARQRELIDFLFASGHDTKLARALLQTFEDMQIMYLADRDRLHNKLEGAR